MAADSSLDTFIAELVSMCPEHFRGLVHDLPYGRKLFMANGCRLVISCTADRKVSRVHAEVGVPPQDVVEAAVSLVRKYSIVDSRQRNRLLASLDELSKSHARIFEQPNVQRQHETAASTGSIDISSTAQSLVDPLSSIVPTATIGLRARRKWMSAQASTTTADESGWSQEIGRRCEQFAFDCIAARFGVASCSDSLKHDEIRLRLVDGDRLLKWLNADGEQHQSWDIEERDARTGEILRRHEVKAKSAELTSAEYALAVQHGDSYMIWRVDADTGRFERCKLHVKSTVSSAQMAAQCRVGPLQIAVEIEREADTTMVILHRNSRAYCRELQYQFQSAVGRYRRNLVVGFAVSPELSKRLPASDAGLWVANRSLGGCRQLLRAACFFGSRNPLREQRLLIVGIQMVSTLGTARAIHLLRTRLHLSPAQGAGLSVASSNVLIASSLAVGT